jgi:hypothetical protein
VCGSSPIRSDEHEQESEGKSLQGAGRAKGKLHCAEIVANGNVAVVAVVCATLLIQYET